MPMRRSTNNKKAHMKTSCRGRDTNSKPFMLPSVMRLLRSAVQLRVFAFRESCKMVRNSLQSNQLCCYSYPNVARYSSQFYSNLSQLLLFETSLQHCLASRRQCFIFTLRLHLPHQRSELPFRMGLKALRL